MGQKDLVSKKLERRPEIYADIINALLYEGKQILAPQNLYPAPVESIYERDDGALHSQYNDVSKYEMHHGKIMLRYTLENQTTPDYKMLFRKAGYEGAIYREQYDGTETYPLITLVLYWGEENWHPAFDMHSYFKRKKIPENAWQYIDNAKLYVFSMRKLPWEVRQRFRSDMRIIVDYLAEGKAYEPTDQEIRNIDDVMRLLYELTGDMGFINKMTELQHRQRKGEKITMCEVIDKFVARGREQGIQLGIEQGIEQGIQKGIQQARTEYAQSCTNLYITQGQSQQSILDMLQTCFQYDKEEARELYKECMN
ncbi:MAG: Rpn family recombination-promoting nuclease/putative transposase [Lachnospiraceae bacterium]|nr:Rpn family recombination-promoting nuclease/putative transposase [Lachnospiraceae bacterium]